jgi:L-lactate dehydrogenase complex protein LldG
MSKAMSTRDEILGQVRLALGRAGGTSDPPVPGRIASRTAAAPAVEMESLLAEIGKLGGKTQQMAPDSLPDALGALVREEGVRRATTWQTPELEALGVQRVLEELGVEVISPYAGKHALAECDLGVTGADGAFPETGTLLLCAGPERPRMVSLVPRIHLAIITPDILLPDLSQGFAKVKGEGYWVFVTGPSRTSDIELTVTIGVHGPKALYVWNVPRA